MESECPSNFEKNPFLRVETDLLSPGLATPTAQNPKGGTSRMTWDFVGSE
jgi:hypothetical protein